MDTPNSLCKPDSLFKSAFRSFLKSFCAITGLFLAFFLIFSIFAPFHEKITSELTILPDLNGETKTLSSSAPVVVQLNIHGIIGDKNNLNIDSIREGLLETRIGFFKKDRVKAILLHLNTPGGTVIDSDSIYTLLKNYKTKYKVPIYAYVEGMCASGGMYIAASCNKIYSSPVSTIGSVGVLMGPFFNLYKMLDKIGVDSTVLTEGKNKDILSPFRPWQEDETDSLKPLAAYIYERFVNIVTQARPALNKEKLINEYGAKVFSAPEAEKLGYIDFGNSSYEAALRDLLKEAKIDEKKPYQVVQVKTKKPWASELFSKSWLFKNKITHELDFGPLSKLETNLAYLYLPQGY